MPLDATRLQRAASSVHGIGRTNLEKLPPMPAKLKQIGGAEAEAWESAINSRFESIQRQLNAIETALRTTQGA